MKQPLWVWIAAVPVLAAVLYTLQRADEPQTAAPVGGVALPRYTASQATLVRYDSDGQATLRGTASSIEYFDDASGRARDLQADLFSDGELRWQLSSPTASMPAHDRRILLEGPVVAQGRWPDNDEPLRITTDQLWVDPDASRFESRQPVRIDGESRQGTAVGLRADWQEHRLQLLHNVKMTYVAAP